MKHAKWWKLLRYAAASGAALAVDVGLILLLNLQLGLHYLWSAAIGFSFGCIVAYVISVVFVFDDQSGRDSKTQFLLFCFVGVLGLGLNHVILYIGVDLFALHVLLAKGISAGIVFWFNFFLRGTQVFQDPDLCRKQV
jgi:Predicted membrane protein